MFSTEKMYTYVRGYASGASMAETLRALPFARAKHEGLLRKSGDAYIVHPLTMACDALALGIREDEVIATILLHDICEDCGVPPKELPVGKPVRHSVSLVTFNVSADETKESAPSRYYDQILKDRAATLTKLVDRCHNVSSMAGPFSREKLLSYISETRRYVIPMIHVAKLRWPEYSDALFVLKYHMVSVVESIEAALDTRESI